MNEHIVGGVMLELEVYVRPDPDTDGREWCAGVKGLNTEWMGSSMREALEVLEVSHPGVSIDIDWRAVEGLEETAGR